MTAVGTFRTCHDNSSMSALEGGPDILGHQSDFRKWTQTSHRERRETFSHWPQRRFGL